jgi:hypothetical protein
VHAARIGVVAMVAACGGPSQQPSNPDDIARQLQPHAVRPDAAGSAAAPDPGEPGEANLPPALAKFHETLAPRWHAEHGAERTARTCGAIAQFRGDADAVAAAASPSGADAAAWTAGGRALVESVAALETACKASDGPAFEQAFAGVHQKFHALIESIGPADRDSNGDPDPQ